MRARPAMGSAAWPSRVLEMLKRQRVWNEVGVDVERREDSLVRLVITLDGDNALGFSLKPQDARSLAERLSAAAQTDERAG